MASVIVNPVSVPTVRTRSVQTPSVRVLPVTGGGGGASLEPSVLLDTSTNTLTFRLFTLEMMEDVKIFFLGVSSPAKFVVTTDEDEFYINFSNDSPEGLAGEYVLDDAVEMYTNKWLLNIAVEIPSTFTINSVYIEGADCNLLEDTQWRDADIQRDVKKTYTETINNGSLLDESIAAQLYAIIGEEESEEEEEES